MPVPFALRRPWLLARDLLSSRADPDLARLQAMADPEAFVWAILPHAARTFAASIALLPGPIARMAAVAYLYCRILDTYEDLIPEPPSREAALGRFRARFARAGGAPLPPAPALDERLARDARDRTHVLLVNRCALVDEVYVGLPAAWQQSIGDLVSGMADGMLRSSRALASQGGVLTTGEQLSEYCRAVIGLPFLFGVRLLYESRAGGGVPAAVAADCLASGEMVQLADVTRDIEQDLGRGVAYHPALRSALGRADANDPALAEQVRRVREDLLQRALRLAPAYERMMAALPFPRVSLARASGVLMLLFTDRYFRSCARRVGRPAWPGAESTLALLLQAIGHAVSPGRSRRTVRGITLRMGAFLVRCGNHPRESGATETAPIA